MGSVVEIKRRRPAIRSGPKHARADDHDENAWKSLIVLAVTFSGAAIAMAIAVVVAGSSTWAQAVPLIACVVVFALTKIVLADALFYVMLRADANAMATAPAASRTLTGGIVIRRRPTAFSSSRSKMAGSRQRQTLPTAITLAPRARIPLAPPPRRPER